MLVAQSRNICGGKALTKQQLYVTGCIEDDLEVDTLVPQPRTDGKSSGQTEADRQRDVTTTERQQFTGHQLVSHGADEYAPETGVKSEDERVADLTGAMKEELGEQSGEDDGQAGSADAVTGGVQLGRVTEQLEHQTTGEAWTSDDWQQQNGIVVWHSCLTNHTQTLHQGDHSFPKRIFHDFSMTKKKMKIMTYRHNIFFQINDTQLMNAYQH